MKTNKAGQTYSALGVHSQSCTVQELPEPNIYFAYCDLKISDF